MTVFSIFWHWGKTQTCLPCFRHRHSEHSCKNTDSSQPGIHSGDFLKNPNQHWAVDEVWEPFCCCWRLLSLLPVCTTLGRPLLSKRFKKKKKVKGNPQEEKAVDQSKNSILEHTETPRTLISGSTKEIDLKHKHTHLPTFIWHKDYMDNLYWEMSSNR